ncbi:MAG: transporter suffix domain-containing protein [Myxococcota bacterium]
MPANATASAARTAPDKSLRYRVGITLFGLSFVFPVLALATPALGLEKAITATLAGGLLVLAEAVGLLGIALAGKQALETIKGKIRALFRRRAPPKPVGRRQYNVGLLLFVLGSLGLFGIQYGPYLVDLEIPKAQRLYLQLACDATIVASLFTMGEQFWEKLKRLVTWEAAWERS